MQCWATDGAVDNMSLQNFFLLQYNSYKRWGNIVINITYFIIVQILHYYKTVARPTLLFHRLAIFLSNQAVIMHIKITETIAFVELKYLRLYKKWHEADFETDSKSKLLYPCCKRRAPLVNLFRRNASIELESLSGVKDKQRSMDAILQKAVLRIHARFCKV